MRFASVVAATALIAVAPSGAAPSDTPAAMKRVVRQWSAHVNRYDNDKVARLFTRPAGIAQSGTILVLRTYADLAEWHRGLPCAGRITSMQVKGRYVTAVFTLERGPHRPCPAAGQQAAALFSIAHGKIAGWAQVPVPANALRPTA